MLQMPSGLVCAEPINLPSAYTSIRVEGMPVPPRDGRELEVGLTATKVGMSFTAASVITTVAGAEDSCPSEALTRKLRQVSSFGAGWNTKNARSAAPMSWPTTTG